MVESEFGDSLVGKALTNCGVNINVISYKLFLKLACKF